MCQGRARAGRFESFGPGLPRAWSLSAPCHAEHWQARAGDANAARNNAHTPVTPSRMMVDSDAHCQAGIAQQLDTKHALSRCAHTTSKVASESGSTVTESVCDSRPGPGDPGPAGMIIAFDSDFFQSFRVSPAASESGWPPRSTLAPLSAGCGGRGRRPVLGRSRGLRVGVTVTRTSQSKSEPESGDRDSAPAQADRARPVTGSAGVQVAGATRRRSATCPVTLSWCQCQLERPGIAVTCL